ncbi:C3 and PZP-like alpha-2-macroglobulin domain-containing protein 8 [Amphiura filiformis]|uniref:C3 and PZP-like alpha-2-macroglobulin domain-containing protein 8 n=1 Tax=Amphiura filiformis TaxID=82378 RepID=UPI003B21E521
MYNAGVLVLLLLLAAVTCVMAEENDCDPNPCENGGSCTCEAGYTGVNCETAVSLSYTAERDNRCNVYETTNSDKYSFMFPRLPKVPGRLTFWFKVLAVSDVHLILSPDPRPVDDSYEIVIGSHKNSRSEIRPCKDCKPAESVSTPDILKCNSMTEFWVKINPEKGEMVVGQGDDQEAEPFLAFSEERIKTQPIFYFGFRTSKNHVGLFMFWNTIM